MRTQQLRNRIVPAIIFGGFALITSPALAEGGQAATTETRPPATTTDTGVSDDLNDRSDNTDFGAAGARTGQDALHGTCMQGDRTLSATNRVDCEKIGGTWHLRTKESVRDKSMNNAPAATGGSETRTGPTETPLDSSDSPESEETDTRP